MKLAHFLENLPGPTQASFQAQLGILSLGTALTRQFVLNLWAECRLSERAWSEIVTAVVNAQPTVPDLVDAIKAAVRGHTLTGGSIPEPWPIFYGRVAGIDAFYDLLIGAKKASNRPQAELVLSRLTRATPDQVHKRLGGLKIGRFTFWATFHPDDVNGHPFALLTGNADHIRCRLGLDRQDQGKKDLLLFVYSLPAGNEPLYPTIADACAGDTWLHFFRPAPEHERSGLTMPWEGPDVPCPGEAPCREVVHAPVAGTDLTKPPRIVPV